MSELNKVASTASSDPRRLSSLMLVVVSILLLIFISVLLNILHDFVYWNFKFQVYSPWSEILIFITYLGALYFLFKGQKRWWLFISMVASMLILLACLLVYLVAMPGTCCLPDITPTILQF